MNWRFVLNILGAISVLSAASMAPALCMAAFGEANPDTTRTQTIAFVESMLLALALGIILQLATRGHRSDRISPSDGFGVACFGWIIVVFLGALPFYLGGSTTTLTNACFESMSGFTTTGASIFGTTREAGGQGLVEKLPVSILFWRSLTHWLGGMGIVMLGLAVLPALRAGGYQLFVAETSGLTHDRLRPRMKDTAAILWGVYIFLTGAEIALLWGGGMPLLDSICHSFGSIATGGFSTKDASLAYYSLTGHPYALYFEVVITVFMFLGGANFLLHYKALHGEIASYWRDGEFRFYAAVVTGSSIVLAFLVWQAGALGGDSFGSALRYCAFNVVSVITTTGFCNIDFEQWPGFCKLWLIALMFIGGCAGSTSGGIKVIRIKLVLRNCLRTLKELVRPRGVFVVKSYDLTIREEIISKTMIFFSAYIVIFAVSSMLVLLSLDLQGIDSPQMNPDSKIVTAFSAVAATINCVGPGLSFVGATSNFGWMPDFAKWVLTFCMLVGRLELYSVIVIFLPLAWRR